MNNTTKPDNSHVVVHASGGTSFVGKDAVSLYRAISLRQALLMYAKSGMRMTRNLTPSTMLTIASEYTGKVHKRGAYLEAAEGVGNWIETMKAAMPIDRPAAAVKCFEFDGTTGIEAEFIAANQDDEALLEWMRTAEVGDVFEGCTRLPDDAPHA